MPKSFATPQTCIARQLESSVLFVHAEILHESYSCTVDMPNMTEAIKGNLEQKGFTVTHEQDSIYTLEL